MVSGKGCGDRSDFEIVREIARERGVSTLVGVQGAYGAVTFEERADGSAELAAHLAAASPYGAIAYLPMWESAEAELADCAEGVCARQCYVFRSSEAGAALAGVSATRGRFTLLALLYKDWFGVGRGHPDMGWLLYGDLRSSFNAGYPKRYLPLAREAAKRFVERYSVVAKATLQPSLDLEAETDADAEAEADGHSDGDAGGDAGTEGVVEAPPAPGEVALTGDASRAGVAAD